MFPPKVDPIQDIPPPTSIRDISATTLPTNMHGTSLESNDSSLSKSVPWITAGRVDVKISQIYVGEEYPDYGLALVETSIGTPARALE